jgi:SAM-dependent methyltransferase
MRKVLNVGGNNKSIPLPKEYAGWQQVLLDIDPRGEPDIVCDARRLSTLPGGEYDAVYCSHNLEHYHRHDAVDVLAGFRHVLKPEGFAHIRVPDIGELMRTVVEKNLDIDDFLYESPAGPITVRDVIYGYGREIEQSGNDFFAHKNGFTKKSLTALLLRCGFAQVFTVAGSLEITAIAFGGEPAPFARALFHLPPAAG